MKRSRVILRAVGLLAAIAAIGPTPAGALQFGINAHTAKEEALDEVVRGSVGWVRIDFRWSRVELERDVYDWRRYDALIDRIEERGIRIFATLSSTPAWATRGSEGSGMPDDPEEWQEFCYLAASRYRGRVHAWGMWNEPNQKRFWEGLRSQYIRYILLDGAAAIRAADPGALICGPDLAHLSNSDWDGWLSDVITEAGHAFDVVTHHLYSSFGRASEVIYDLETKPNLPYSSPSVRRLLEDTGWYGRPFWLTETGLQSSEYSLNAQAEFYEELLEDCFDPDAEAWWVDRIFFYHLHDPPEPASTTWGILHGLPDLTRKPAFYSYRDFVDAAVVDDAEMAVVDLPSFVLPGEVVDGTAVVRNIGTTIWRNADGVRLDASFDTPGWTVDPVRIPGSLDVAPGESVELTIRMQAPVRSGAAEAESAGLYARMIRRGGRRFGDPLSATITVADTPPPEILEHPASTSAIEGARVSLSVQATSDTPLRYRWRRNSVELLNPGSFSGADSPQLTVNGFDRHLEGDYDCLVSNDTGTVVTDIARLGIGLSPPRRPSGRSNPGPNP